MRSDRGGGNPRLWPSPPGRWRQHRAGSAEAGPGRRRRAAERGWSSFGSPSSRWWGCLASIGCCGSRGLTGPCANHRVGRLSSGTWPSRVPCWCLRPGCPPSPSWRPAGPAVVRYSLQGSGQMGWFRKHLYNRLLPTESQHVF